MSLLNGQDTRLAEIAQKIGDVSHDYCQAILDKVAETGGWLWKQADISKEIDDMLCEYEVISLLKPLCGFADFVPYKNAFGALKTAVTQTNRLPMAMLESVYPVLSAFLAAVMAGDSVQDINIALSQNSAIIQKLFFDATKAESVKILKKHLNGVLLSDAELFDILSGIPSGFGLDESTFLDGVRTKIEEYAKESVVQNLKKEWRHLSGADTPSEWAVTNGIPARFLLGNLPQVNDLLKAIEQPETFSAVKLSELFEILKDPPIFSIAECQKAFLTETVPPKYAKFNISLSSLLEFLREKCGPQPNNWSPRLDIADFIRKQYKGTFAPQIAEKIRSKPADELKTRLLQLAKENEELGLLFWED